MRLSKRFAERERQPLGRALSYAVVVALFALAHMPVEPYDDAHFFKRVALHALEHGTLSWNLDEGPVYGITSQLFQGLALLTAALTRDHYMIATRVGAAIWLLGAFLLLRRLTDELDRGLAAALVFTSPVMLYPVLSGMETSFVFLLLSGWLWAMYGAGAERRAGAVAALIALVYLVRPDALLLVLPPFLVEHHGRTRRIPLRELALITGLVGAALVGFRLYYGTALPLPFYAKQAAFSPYDAHFIAASNEVRKLRFGVFVAFAAPAVMLALQKRDRTNLVLLGSVATFAAYHFVATIDVMGMQGRFYAPTMPLIAFAAARGVAELAAHAAQKDARAIAAAYLALFAVLWAAGWLPRTTGFRLERVELVTYLTMVPALALACAAAAAPAWHARVASSVLAVAACSMLVLLKRESFHLYSDEEYLTLHTARYTVYRGLDTLRSCFGERIHVYHSEVGVPGLRFQQGKVSDLAGLLSPKWLFRAPHSFDLLCAQDRPEAIFLPHKNYRALNAEIARGNCIERYRRVVESSSCPLYVRDDLYPRYRACAQARRDPYATR